MSKTPKFEEQEPLTEEELVQFRKVLEERRARLLDEAEEHAETVKEAGALRMSDEVDLASAEYEQAFEHRLRDREKGLLRKLEKALKRIDDGEYGECESCGNFIGAKRLSARPEATLCIECKEEQERVESKFKKEREDADQFPFK
ncbi:MAG: TraR/DksA C4-type zinc finger protein [Deltaproteobacteria bacterium]|nr:TraR/DksA C4-type zinc finger protein [Deltaproteobacteria bacterium]MCB9788169.1 TraR/DksA C4-type zinc finger protein [Deltaproteobacteria bacterium]